MRAVIKCVNLPAFFTLFNISEALSVSYCQWAIFSLHVVDHHNTDRSGQTPSSKSLASFLVVILSYCSIRNIFTRFYNINVSSNWELKLFKAWIDCHLLFDPQTMKLLIDNKYFFNHIFCIFGITVSSVILFIHLFISHHIVLQNHNNFCTSMMKSITDTCVLLQHQLTTDVSNEESHVSNW